MHLEDQEVISLLKESLRVSVSIDRKRRIYDSVVEVTVKLYVRDELVSESTDELPLPEEG